MYPVLYCRVEIDRKDQIDITLSFVFYETRSFRVHEVQIHLVVIDDPERIDQEFRVEPDQKILSLLGTEDDLIHGSKLGLDLQFHGVIPDIDDDRLFISFLDEESSTVDTVEQFSLIDPYFCLVIT